MMRTDIVFQVPLLTAGGRGLRDGEQDDSDQSALLAAGKRDSRQGSPVFTVLLSLFVCVFLLAFSMDSLINNFDNRIFVTTTDTFYRFFALKDVFIRATNYSLRANPPVLTHGVFDPVPDSLQEWQDLRNRRLISPEEYDVATRNLSAYNELILRVNGPSLLWNLLRLSWCSYPNALPGTTPITRSSGCECIGRAYLGFILETMGNITAPFSDYIVNTTAAARDKYGSEVVTCFDRRQVSRTQTCGLFCSTHSAGLVLYVNTITFLALIGYLVFSEHALILKGVASVFTQLFVLKLFIVVLAAALASPFYWHDVEANVLNLTGIALCVVYLTLTLHDELNFPAMDKANHYIKRRSACLSRSLPVPILPVPLTPVFRRYIGVTRKPHPLTVTLLVHLQLILPAYGALIAVSGYARDTWAIFSFAATLWLIGLIMQVVCVVYGIVLPLVCVTFRTFQRFFWTYWYSSGGRDDTLVNQTSLTFCFVALWILLVLLFTAYYYQESLYITGSIWIFCVFAVYLVLMMGLLIGDRVQLGVMDELESTFYFTIYQQGMLLLTIVLNIIFTATALVDTTRNAI